MKGENKEGVKHKNGEEEEEEEKHKRATSICLFSRRYISTTHAGKWDLSIVYISSGGSTTREGKCYAVGA